MGQRVLVVDDEVAVVELIGDLLASVDLDILPAFDVDQAREQLGHAPDLVVLDIALGAHNGMALLQEIRRQNAMPVIMLTAQQGEQEIIRALDLGADDYVTKPFSNRELLARIRGCLRRAPDGQLRREEGQARIAVQLLAPNE